MPRIDYDAIIAGAGIAGTAAAAALTELGWSVLIVEPGQHPDRRLAGELIHPPGVAGLVELGLFDQQVFSEAALLQGFMVFPDAGERGIALPYAPSAAGYTAFSLDHGTIRNAMQAAIARRAAVTVRCGRIVAIDTSDPAAPTITLGNDGQVEVLRCRIVVAADGAISRVRALAGIRHVRRKISTITGFVVGCDNLPAPGYGHLFIGAPSPVLVYEIGGGKSRVLFDQPVDQLKTDAAEHFARVLCTLPEALRTEVTKAMEVQRGLRFACMDVLVDGATRGPVVLAGDAGGSCHPLTATGMTVCIADALRLREALRDGKGNVGASLSAYGRSRRLPQCARHLVASVLHQACSRNDPALMLVRSGLVHYWLHDERSRRASMAILALCDTSVVSVLREMAKVIFHGMANRARSEGRNLLTWVLTNLRLMSALSATVIRHMTVAMRAR